MDAVDVYIHMPTGLSVRVETDEDGAPCASVPVLPGCVAGGSTLEEALGDLSLAIEAVLDVLREDDPGRYHSLVSAAATPSPGLMDADTTAGAQLSMKAVAA